MTMKKTPRTSSGAKTRAGKSCGGTKMIPAQARTGQKATPQARVPSTAPARVSALMRALCRASAARARFYRLGGALCAILSAIRYPLSAIVFFAGVTAAAELGTPQGPQPCAPALATAGIRKVDAPTAIEQLGGTFALPLPWQPMLADLDVKGMTLGGFGLLAALIGYHFVFRSYIREQAGITETQTTEISGQPIQVQKAVKFIAEAELDERLAGYVRTEDLQQMERRICTKMEEDFRELDNKRGHSIGNLHEHLTGTTKSLTEKIEHASARQHDRTDALAQQVGVLIGEVRGLTANVTEATRTAQAAAVAAAQAGRKS